MSTPLPRYAIIATNAKRTHARFSYCYNAADLERSFKSLKGKYANVRVFRGSWSKTGA